MGKEEIIRNNLSEGYSKQIPIGVVIKKCMEEYARIKCKEPVKILNWILNSDLTKGSPELKVTIEQAIKEAEIE